MGDKIQNFTTVEFEYLEGTLDFSTAKLEMTAKSGEIIRGEFVILGSEEKKTKAFLKASSNRMQFSCSAFEGNDATIQYTFQTKGLEEGDVQKGEIAVISNKGEYYLPYVVTIGHTEIDSSIGKIKNLFHFANLAKSNWDEAVHVFYLPEFSKVFNGSDKQYLPMYRGLCQEYGNQRNVDEFLIGIHKKQKLEYLVIEKELSISNPEGIVEEFIHITRNGWGYTHLGIIYEADFLYLHKESITDDDFLGNSCELPIYIDSTKLHYGNNYGKIQLWYDCECFEVDIHISYQLNKKEVQLSIQEKTSMMAITKLYLDFRTKRLDMDSWLNKTMDVVDRYILQDENNCVAKLFQAQILMTKERYNEARWVLDHVEQMLEKEEYPIEIRCYYLYLSTLHNREESYVNEITSILMDIYIKNKGNWKIAWLLLYLDEELNRSQQKRWAFLEELYAQGCISPIILLEAVQLLNLNPALLMKLSDFEYRVLYYACKKELLSHVTIDQIIYVVGRVKEYNKQLLDILIYCYEMEPRNETLTLICQILIKGNETRKRYFPWYQRAIKEELRITKLYEFYMMTIPMDGTVEIPRIVQLYFAYDAMLPYERKAFLYASIMKNEEKVPEMVRSYMEQMQKFVTQQIKLGHINRDLAYLYKVLLTPNILGREVAQALVSLIFMHEITVENDQMKQVVVIHNDMKGEIRYPIYQRKAILPIYSSEYQLFIQDSFGNRFLQTIDYTLEKLMSPRQFASLVFPYVRSHLGYDLYLCQGLGNFTNIIKENVSSFARIVASAQVRNDYKREIRCKLLQFYYDQDQIDEMDECLESITPNGIDAKERAELIKFFVMRGMFEKAYQWIDEFGVEGNDVRTIVRLTSRMLTREQMYQEEKKKDAVMLEMVTYVFREGKYDEAILNYLISYQDGMTKELRKIWRAAKDFSLDTYVIEEKILKQILFSRAFIGERAQIFESYYLHRTSKVITSAFVEMCAYEYFIKQRVTDELLFPYFLLECEQDTTNIVVMLASLYYIAQERKEWITEKKELVANCVKQLYKRGIYFPFFKEFMTVASELRELYDQTIIEYRCNPNARVVIHYVCEKDKEVNAQYKKQDMMNMYGGVFIKSFTLFFGEKLQYYITEELNGEEQLTESGCISKSDVTRDETETRFSLLNDVVMSHTLQDYETLDKLMEEYVYKEYASSELFKMH